MTSKVSSINLYDAETKTEKFDIEVSSSKVDFTCSSNQYIKVHPSLHLVNATDGDITDVDVKLHSIDEAIAAGNAGSAAASALVQSNVDAYIASNNTALATVSATVTSNKAITDQHHIDDAVARLALQTSLESKISDEETARIYSDTVLTTALTAETNTQAAAISTEQSTRSTAVANLQSQIDTEKARIDGMLAGSQTDLNSFLELVNNYSQLNTDALTQITSLQTQVNTLQSIIDELTA